VSIMLLCFRNGPYDWQVLFLLWLCTVHREGWFLHKPPFGWHVWILVWHSMINDDLEVGMPMLKPSMINDDLEVGMPTLES